MKNRNTAATRLTTKGQVVIPKTIRNSLGWKPGTALRVDVDGGAVTLRPVTRGTAQAWLEAVAGCVEQGDPIADLEAEHRAEIERDALRRS